MGLIIFCALFNLIVWMIIVPIVLIKLYDNDVNDFGIDFIFCGIIITVLNILGTFMIILAVFGIIFDVVYYRYIEFIVDKIGRKK